MPVPRKTPGAVCPLPAHTNYSLGYDGAKALRRRRRFIADAKVALTCLEGLLWVIADLVAKAWHVRTLPIPMWVKAAVEAWTNAAGIAQGRVFRAINKTGRVCGDGMSAKVLWDVVRGAAARAGIEKLASMICAAHVRGCVILPTANGPDSVSSGTRLDSDDGALPRCKQRLRCAVNDL